VIYPVDPRNLEYVWPEVKKLIGPAVQLTGEYSLFHVYDYIDRRTWQLWVYDKGEGIEAAFTLEVINYPLKKTIRIIHAGGSNLDLWRDQILVALEDYAFQIKADTIDLVGRKGWIKKLADLGDYTVYTMTRRL